VAAYIYYRVSASIRQLHIAQSILLLQLFIFKLLAY